MDKKCILIIEDQEEIRRNLEELLLLSNYEVIATSNGREGVKLALSLSPNLILCDIMIPEIDGHEVLYLLSKNPSTSSIPFIFLTAKSEQSDFRKGMNMGADDYLTKPFEEIELLNAIERRIHRYDELLNNARKMGEFVNSAKKYKNLEALENEQKVRLFKKKDTIYREGDYGAYVYKIKRGKVRTYRINECGKELVHDLLKEGDLLGESAIIQNGPRTEFAEALEDTELILIPGNDFQELIFGDRQVSSQFIKLLSRHLSEKEHKLMDMAYNTVRKRTADSLMKLYKTYENGQKLVGFDIARSDLASMVGTATESVIRILSEFKKNEWIEIHGSSISILQPEKIETTK